MLWQYMYIIKLLMHLRSWGCLKSWKVQELNSNVPQATLMPLSCSPNFSMHHNTNIYMLNHEWSIIVTKRQTDWKMGRQSCIQLDWLNPTDQTADSPAYSQTDWKIGRQSDRLKDVQTVRHTIWQTDSWTDDRQDQRLTIKENHRKSISPLLLF